MNRLSVLASVAVWVLVVSLLAGCAGFTVQFGVHEVNETAKTERLVKKTETK